MLSIVGITALKKKGLRRDCPAIRMIDGVLLGNAVVLVSPDLLDLFFKNQKGSGFRQGFVFSESCPPRGGVD